MFEVRASSFLLLACRESRGWRGAWLVFLCERVMLERGSMLVASVRCRTRPWLCVRISYRRERGGEIAYALTLLWLKPLIEKPC